MPRPLGDFGRKNRRSPISILWSNKSTSIWFIFWAQLGNSRVIALSVGAITLAVSTAAAFAISRLKVRGGRTVMNLALFYVLHPRRFPRGADVQNDG